MRLLKLLISTKPYWTSILIFFINLAIKHLKQKQSDEVVTEKGNAMRNVYVHNCLEESGLCLQENEVASTSTMAAR